MNKFRFTIKLVVIATFLLAFASIAQAQATRTWVSGVGDDVNPCSRTAPCKTYAGAISKTATNGEISTLDPGGFGAVTITKGMTIDGTTGAGFGSILAANVTGVIVNDTTNLGVVTLRNLSINGASTAGGSGIRFLAGKALIVEDCDIFGFTGTPASTTVGNGIIVNATAGPKNVFIKDTNITNCTVGIRITTSASFVVAVLDNLNIDATGNQVAGTTGLEVGANAFVTVRNSTFARWATGVNVTGGAASQATLIGSLLHNNLTGFSVGGSTSHTSDTSYIRNDTQAILLTGGAIRTGCNNFFEANGAEVNGGALSNSCVH
jgi:hypothetical protein